jgi:hydrogenase nickel incorporation protein HypA/HybF
MHELAICQGLMREVERVARQHGAERVTGLTLQIGALAGVEPELLAQAFTIARAGSIAETAELSIESIAPRVRCSACGADSEAAVNRLVCGSCGDWRVQVVTGDEMLLKSVELVRDDAAPEPAS